MFAWFGGTGSAARKDDPLRELSSGRKRPSSIAWILVAFSCAIFVAAVLVISTVSYNMYKTAFYNYSSQLCTESNNFAAYMIDGDEVERISQTMTVDDGYRAFAASMDELADIMNAKYCYILFDNGVPGMYTYIYDATHSEEFSGEEYALGRNETVDEYVGVDVVLSTGKGFETAEYYNDYYGELYYAYAPILNSSGEAVAFVGTDIDIAPLRGELDAYRVRIIVIALIVSLIYAAATMIIIRRILSRPMEKITGNAIRLAQGSLELVPAEDITRRNSEIGQLGKAFEEMAASISGVIYDARRNLRIVRGGRLSERVDVSAYQGEYNMMLSVVNATLDVFCHHLDSLPEAVAFFDKRERRMLYGNAAMLGFMDAYGLSDEDPSLLAQIMSAFQSCALSAEAEALFGNGEYNAYSSELTFGDESGLEQFYTLCLLRVDGGSQEDGDNNTCVMMTLVDDTPLIRARNEAEQASRAKGEFLSRMSHEMRTPMTAILGMTDIARNTDDPVKKEHCLSRIDEASKHLLGVINDILDMSKIEAEKFELSPSEYNFEQMLMKVINVVNFKADEKKQNLVVNLSPNIPTTILGDEQRMAQVITNLLSNAVKFTPENGSIILNAGAVSHVSKDITLQITIEDTGIGISEEQKKRLFHSFEQADGGISRKFGGTGLGLAISKRIVELMGGSIYVESNPGRGSKFIFTAMVGESGAQPPQALFPRVKRADVRVLAVDDSPETREYFLSMMEEWKLPCDVAASGREALALLDAAGDKPYNIFFVDWQMPGMNGIELTRRIKELTRDNSVVIMISVAEWHDIENEAVSAGVNRFVPKPLFPSTLINAINECLGVDHGHSGVLSGELGSDITGIFRGKSILLAEDVDVNREIISAILEKTEVAIHFACNGREALSMFTAHPKRYDLILMDIHMPEMSGFEATRCIRSLNYEEARAVPIVAMTANVFKEDIESCLAAGMNDHVGKPINTVELFDKMRYYMPKRAERDDLVSNGSMGVNDKGSLDYSELYPALDVKGGLERLLNNKKLYVKLLTSFDARKMVGDCITAIESDDNSAISQAAHALKGVSANLGLKDLMDLTLRIESQAKSGIACDGLIKPLEEALDAAQNAIERLLKSDEAKN